MSEYYLLGECVEISSPKGKFKLENFLLLAYMDGNHLLALPFDNARKVHQQVNKNLQSAYFEFHGKEYRNTVEVDYPEGEFEYFSKATSVLYRSDKRHGGGDGRSNLFRHQFGATVYLWKSPENDGFIMGGKNLKVTDRGIEH
jgi:hypothetical protein